MQLPKRPAPGVSAAGQGQSNSLRWGRETEAGCSFLLCMAPSWALQPHLCCIRLNDKGCPCSKWGVGKLKSYIQTRTCAVNNNVEQERHTPWDTVIQNASSDVPSCWREARDASRLATITWWSRLQLCQPGKLSVRLSSFCFAGKRSLLCPTVDFTACLAAGVSGQQTPANRSPEENAWFPIALTVTVIVLHVNRSKAGELRCVWPLSWLIFAFFKFWLLPLQLWQCPRPHFQQVPCWEQLDSQLPPLPAG